MSELHGTYDGWKTAAPEPMDDDDDTEAECPYCNRRETQCGCP